MPHINTTTTLLLILLAWLPVRTMANETHSTEESATCTRLFDYTHTTSSQGKASQAWYSVNDNVMGGRSLGSASFNQHTLEFQGRINTDGGGFASIRHELQPQQLASADRLRLSVRSDGRRYSINLGDKRSAAARITHRAALNTQTSVNFQTVEVLFSDLVPTFRGRVVEAGPFNPEEAISLSIMLSDGTDGPFSLSIEWIDVCRFSQ